DSPRGQQQRKMPGDGGRDHPDGFAERVRQVPAVDWNRLAVNLVGPSSVVLETFGRGGNLDLARFENRFAVVQRFEPRKLVRAFENRLRQLRSPRSSIARGQSGPRSPQ